MIVEKSRFLHPNPETNSGKLKQLNDLFTEYVFYVKICVQIMLDKHTFHLPKSAKQAFFPPAENLTSQIEKNARDHAIQLVKSWSQTAYRQKTRNAISLLKKEGFINGDRAKRLYIVGKHGKNTPHAKGKWAQEDLDAYWLILLSSAGPKPPEVTERIGMRLSEDTSRLESPDKPTNQGDFWLRVSTLKAYKSLWIPLVGSPYVKSTSDVGKGLLARKLKCGRWRFEALDTKEWEVPEPKIDAPKVGIDVGLNVIAATSDGRLYGRKLKPKFDALYSRVQKVRANRQRQELKENSPRLTRLESRLTGLMKSAVGEVANQLKRDYLGYVFAHEDLDLRGCKGQKRFLYRGLHHALISKVPTLAVNPAYTSQECPSCHYVSRLNRRGIKFKCGSCGRISHADVVGAMSVLGRSEDEHICCEDSPSVVKGILDVRYRTARDSPSELRLKAPKPMGLRLDTGGSPLGDEGAVSKLMPKIT